MKKRKEFRETKTRPISDELGQLLTELQQGGSDDPLLHWLSADAPEDDINLALKRFATAADLVSARTRSRLHLTARRFRFTLATEMARKDGKQWGVPEHFEDDDIDIIDESRTKIRDILTTPGDSVLYVYDFGDNWRHSVALERILPASATMVRPVCLAGERHCPPEDVGGVSGYEEFLAVIFEPGHEEHEHYVRWAGGPSPLNRSVGRFQPEEFNVRAVNDALSRMRWPIRHRR